MPGNPLLRVLCLYWMRPEKRATYPVMRHARKRGLQLARYLQTKLCGEDIGNWLEGYTGPDLGMFDQYLYQ